MRQKEKFKISLSLMILAYAYAVTGYVIPSLLSGMAAAMIAVCTHSIRCLKSHMLWILSFSLIQNILILVSGLDQYLPTLVSLTVCNSVFSVCSCDNSHRMLCPSLQFQLTCMMCFLLAILVLPSSWIMFLMPRMTESRMLECGLILLIFMPLLINDYLHHLRHVKDRSSIRVIDDKLS